MAGKVYAQVYEIVKRVPRGKVVTYGQISYLLGGRLSAQGVGWALKALRSPAKDVPYHSDNVPWQRVVNQAGQTSTHKNPDIPPGLQRLLLEAEGVKFGPDETIDMKRYLWAEMAFALNTRPDEPTQGKAQRPKSP